MELNLERPILFFDIESTGLNIASDSIIELSFVKVLPGDEVRVRTWRVRPWDYVTDTQRKINPSAQEVHKTGWTAATWQDSTRTSSTCRCLRKSWKGSGSTGTGTYA